MPKNSIKNLTYEEVRKSKEGAMNLHEKKNLMNSIHEKIEFFKVSNFDSGNGETNSESLLDKYLNPDGSSPFYSHFIRNGVLIPE